jgi:NAD+ diphosphatase
MDVNAFSGAGLDRVSWRRGDDAWLTARREDPSARALVTVRGELALDAEGAPLIVAPDAVAPLEGTIAVLLGLQANAAGAPAADGSGVGAAADPVDAAGAAAAASPAAHEPTGSPLYAIEAAEAPAGARLGGLRDLVVLLGQSEGAAIAYAAAMGNWHRRHRYCPNCGNATEVRQAGFQRFCPVCQAHHFPRTDPVVIMLVVDPAGDRVLLGRQAAWPAGRYSCLAGFVEPGESLEEAVAREVGEEAAVAVDEVVYRSSQPWPFPASLMLGFHCRYAGGEPRRQDEELQDLRWFSRADLADGSALLPPPHAIARRLIDEWVEGEGAR